METKHTKGEWTTEECSNGGLIVCLGDTKDWKSQRIQIANKANAKLIASAPELLDILINAVKNNNIKGLDYSLAIDAIKKATE